MSKIKSYIKLLRPKHWVKNVLVFVPNVFAGTLFHLDIFLQLITVFFSFSLIASTVYIINDINDAEKDRQHEIKKHRPIASGDVKISEAIILCVIIATLSLVLLYLSKPVNIIGSFVALLIYLVTNILYSRGLKNKPIIDVMILAAGFVLRVIFGAQVGRLSENPDLVKG